MVEIINKFRSIIKRVVGSIFSPCCDSTITVWECKFMWPAGRTATLLPMAHRLRFRLTRRSFNLNLQRWKGRCLLFLALSYSAARMRSFVGAWYLRVDTDITHCTHSVKGTGAWEMPVSPLVISTAMIKSPSDGRRVCGNLCPRWNADHFAHPTRSRGYPLRGH